MNGLARGGDERPGWKARLVLAVVMGLPFLACPLWGAAKVVLEDGDVKVILAENTPGQKSNPHRHTVNRVMIALSPGKMRLTYTEGEQAGKTADHEFQTGDWWWDPANGMHTSENIGGTTYRLIEIELKREGGKPVTWPAGDPAQTAAGPYKVEADNEQVRVLRLHLGPKEKTAIHEHVLPRVTVYVQNQQVRMVLPNGRGSDFRYTAGQVSRGGRAQHAEVNLGTEPLDIYFVELKGAASGLGDPKPGSAAKKGSGARRTAPRK